MWMGIDVGTGGTRALLVDAQGRVAAGFMAAHEDIRMERPLSVSYTHLDAAGETKHVNDCQRRLSRRPATTIASIRASSTP